MAGSGRRQADSLLVAALAGGATVADAAKRAAVSERTGQIVVNRGLAGYPEKLLLAVLAHELQHAADHADHGAAQTQGECLDREIRAFTTQAVLWTGSLRRGITGLWRQSALFEELDLISSLVFRDPQRLVTILSRAYQDQCV